MNFFWLSLSKMWNFLFLKKMQMKIEKRFVDRKENLNFLILKFISIKYTTLAFKMENNICMCFIYNLHVWNLDTGFFSSVKNWYESLCPLKKKIFLHFSSPFLFLSALVLNTISAFSHIPEGTRLLYHCKDIHIETVSVASTFATTL